MRNIEIENDEATVKVNPELFSLDAIYSAAYVLLDRAYFSFDGDPDSEVVVYIRSKEGHNIEEISKEFNNQLVNYSVYERESERNEDVRSAIIERALGTNLEGEFENMEEVEDFLSPGKREEDE